MTSRFVSSERPDSEPSRLGLMRGRSVTGTDERRENVSGTVERRESGSGTAERRESITGTAERRECQGSRRDQKIKRS